MRNCSRCFIPLAFNSKIIDGDKNMCLECNIKIGGQKSYSNVKQYFLNKEYFSKLVISQLKKH